MKDRQTVGVVLLGCLLVVLVAWLDHIRGRPVSPAKLGSLALVVVLLSGCATRTSARAGESNWNR